LLLLRQQQALLQPTFRYGSGLLLIPAAAHLQHPQLYCQLAYALLTPAVAGLASCPMYWPHLWLLVLE
jgi:hypothetical protein